MTRSEEIQEKIDGLNERYLKLTKKILLTRAYLFGDLLEATHEQDLKEGFDAVLTFGNLKVPIRIRGNEYFKRFLDITIRTKSNGGKTEIDKLKEKVARYYFYAWENEASNGFTAYVILDIYKFIDTGLIDKPKDINIGNGDGTFFNTYGIENLLKAGVVLIFEKLD